MVLFFRNWDELGFRELKGIPTVGSAGRSVVEREPYLHHPVGCYWLIYLARRLFGWREWSFRIVSYLALIASCAMTVLLASRHLPALWGLGAGLLLPVLGMVFGFGLMANTDPLVLAFGLLIMLVEGRERRAPHRGLRSALHALFFLGAFVEWSVAFFVPALLLREFLLPKEERQVARALRFALPVIASWTACILYFIWGVGDADFVIAQVLHAGSSAAAGKEGADWGGFIANQYKTWKQYFGWPLLLSCSAFAVAFLVSKRVRAQRSVRELAPFALPCILSLLLFRAPAYDHDFFWMPLLVVLPTGLVLMARALWMRRPALAALLVISFFASSVWSCLLHEKITSGDRYRQVGELINTVAGANDLVMTTEAIGPVMFYAKARMVSPLTSPEYVEMALRLRREGKAEFERIFIWVGGVREPYHDTIEAWARENGTRLPYPSIKAWIIDPR